MTAEAGPVALATNTADQNIVTCGDITAPLGTLLAIEATLVYQSIQNTADYGVVTVLLKEDGATIATFKQALAPSDQGDPKFLIDATIPVSWNVSSDGDPHVYSIDVTTDTSSDGTQSIEQATILVSNLQ